MVKAIWSLNFLIVNVLKFHCNQRKKKIWWWRSNTFWLIKYHFRVSFLWSKSGFYHQRIFPVPLCNVKDVLWKHTQNNLIMWGFIFEYYSQKQFKLLYIIWSNIKNSPFSEILVLLLALQHQVVELLHL